MKKMTCLVLCFALIFSLLVGCGVKDDVQPDPGTNTSTPADSNPVNVNDSDVNLEPKKIAVASFSTDQYALLYQTYFSDYIGPRFNVEFMYSEGLSSAEDVITFLENAYAAGCEGVINYVSESTDQITAKANELGLYIVTNTTKPGTETKMPYNLGYVGADTATSAKDFALLIRDLIGDDTKKHNFVMLSGGAGLGKANDLACTVSALQTIADIYGFEYEKDVNDLASVRAETECVNNSDITVTVYPGYDNTDTYAPGLSALLQTGIYDIILCNSTAFASAATVIDEVERASGVNIEIVAKAQVNDTIETSFATKDSFGDTFLHSAVLTPSISTAASLFAIVYNGITGYADVVRQGGEAIFFDNPKWVCYNAGEYEAIKQLNVSDDTWEITAEDMEEVLGVYNPNVTANEMYDFIIGTGNLQATLARRGFQ